MGGGEIPPRLLRRKTRSIGPQGQKQPLEVVAAPSMSARCSAGNPEIVYLTRRGGGPYREGMRKPVGTLCGWFTFQFLVYWLEPMYPLGDWRWLLLSLGGAAITMLVFRPEVTSALHGWKSRHPNISGDLFWRRPWIAIPTLVIGFHFVMPPVFLVSIYGLRLSIAFWIWMTDGDEKSFVQTFEEVVEKANQRYKKE